MGCCCPGSCPENARTMPKIDYENRRKLSGQFLLAHFDIKLLKILIIFAWDLDLNNLELSGSKWLFLKYKIYLEEKVMSKTSELPQLPRGQGSMNLVNNGNAIRYRKRIILQDGSKMDLSVTCATPKECMEAMFLLEKNTRDGYVPKANRSLYDAMVDWVELYKKPNLKPQSYRSIRSTVNNQIKKSALAKEKYQSITGEQLRALLLSLNEKGYSRSTIKKTHDALTEFYREKAYEENFKDPMANIKMIKTSNIKKKEKEIEFFDDEDIKKFTETAISTWKTGTPKYRYGCVLAANIFLGLRVGELLALKWENIDWEAKTIRVDKTLITDDEDDFDYYKDQNSGKKKTKFVVQNETKTSRVRYVPINPNAYNLLKLHYERSVYTEPEDYVLSSYTKNNSLITTLSDSLMFIENRAQTQTRATGTHVLRHTCASLLFRKGVPVEIIASILGNSREVCERIYVHFIEEQRKAAVAQISLGSFFDF